MSYADKIGRLGRIRKGKHKGFFVRIDDDSPNTGGYLVLSWREDSAEGYDNWIEKLELLDNFFEHVNWDVEWLT